MSDLPTRVGCAAFGSARRAIGCTNLWVSPVGFRVRGLEARSPLHRRALADGVRAGINLIDAADASAQALVGEVLGGLERHEGIARAGVVLVVRVPVDGVETAVEAALARLGGPAVDFAVVEVPAPVPGSPPPGEAAFRTAFARLEALCQRGALRYYGVAAEAFGAADAARTLSQCEGWAAREGGQEHHLAWVEGPVRLGPAGPAVVAAAQRLGLGAVARDVLVPLHALERAMDVDRFAEARQVLAAVRKLEARWATGLASRLVTAAGESAEDLFRWGQELAARLDGLEGMQAWQTLRHEVIAPHLGKTSAALLQTLPDPVRREFAVWWAEYGTRLHEAFAAIERGLGRAEADAAKVVREALDPELPAAWREAPPDHKLLWSVLAMGFTAALVDLRQPAHVHDIAKLREDPEKIVSAPGAGLDFVALGQAAARIGL